MDVLITGGTGFIGRSLCRTLAGRGHRLTLFVRSPEKAQRLLGDGPRLVTDLNDLPSSAHFDAIINLAGEPIADRRWSEHRKKKLRNSRIETTEKLVALCQRLEHRPQVLVSGSAIGYYGDQGQHSVVETTPPNDEFTHRLCRDWESAARLAAPLGIRVCLLRTGLVIGPNGGFLKKMLPSFRWGLGAKLGDGQQIMSWIHRADLIRIILFLLQHRDAEGAFNATAPQPVSNETFSRALASQFNKPLLFSAPGWALKTALGEMSRLLLTGQKVIPERLLTLGFQFDFTELEPALADAIGKSSKLERAT